MANINNYSRKFQIFTFIIIALILGGCESRQASTSTYPTISGSSGRQSAFVWYQASISHTNGRRRDLLLGGGLPPYDLNIGNNEIRGFARYAKSVFEQGICRYSLVFSAEANRNYAMKLDLDSSPPTAFIEDQATLQRAIQGIIPSHCQGASDMPVVAPLR